MIQLTQTTEVSLALDTPLNLLLYKSFSKASTHGQYEEEAQLQHENLCLHSNRQLTVLTLKKM